MQIDDDYEQIFMQLNRNFILISMKLSPYTQIFAAAPKHTTPPNIYIVLLVFFFQTHISHLQLQLREVQLNSVHTHTPTCKYSIFLLLNKIHKIIIAYYQVQPFCGIN